MTAWAGSLSPNTVAVHRVDPNVSKKQRLRAAAPPLTIPAAYDDDDHRTKSSSRRTLSCSLSFHENSASKFRTCAVFLVTLCAAFVLAGSVVMWLAKAWHTTEVLGGDGFAENEEFLTAADYAAAFEPGKPNGASCFTAADCLAGSICAFPSVHNNSIRVCCSDAISLGGADKFGPEDQLWLNVCTGAPLGEACASHDEICASGHCIGGRCVAEALPDREHCQKDSDCTSGACAFWGHDLRDDPRCCPGGHAIHLKPAALPYELAFCGNLPLGAVCGDVNEICASGWCSHGVCRDESTRRHKKTSTNTTTTVEA